MELVRECNVVCKVCGVTAFIVYRRPIGMIGGYEHVRSPEPEPEHRKNCRLCGGELVRQ